MAGNRYFNWSTSPSRLVRFDTARAEDVNGALDTLSTAMDSLDDDINRAIKLPPGSEDQVLNLSPLQRAGLILSFDLSGNLAAIAGGGRFRGDWMTGTAYITGDLFRDPVAGDLYAVDLPHIAGVLADDIAANKAKIILDVGQVEGYRTAAAASAVAANNSAIAAAASAVSANNSKNSASGFADDAAASAIDAANAALGAADKAPLDGVGTSGTWPISITGTAVSAATATEATYSNAANAQWSSAAINSSTAISNDSRSATIVNGGGSGDTGVAALGFLCSGVYGIKLHLRADGVFGLGGWTSSAWRWYSDASGNMTVTGDVIAYSDERLKKDFAKIQDPLAKIRLLDGGTFTWKAGYSHTEMKAGKKDYGIIAQQVEAVMPEIVHESIEIDGEKYKTVAYEKLAPLFIEAIKALELRIIELESGK